MDWIIFRHYEALNFQNEFTQPVSAHSNVGGGLRCYKAGWIFIDEFAVIRGKSCRSVFQMLGTADGSRCSLALYAEFGRVFFASERYRLYAERVNLTSCAPVRKAWPSLRRIWRTTKIRCVQISSTEFNLSRVVNTASRVEIYLQGSKYGK
jgi:hypothetical protein